MEENNQKSILQKVEAVINDGEEDILNEDEKEWLKSRYFTTYIAYIDAIEKKMGNNEIGDEADER